MKFGFSVWNSAMTPGLSNSGPEALPCRLSPRAGARKVAAYLTPPIEPTEQQNLNCTTL